MKYVTQGVSTITNRLKSNNLMKYITAADSSLKKKENL